MKNLYKPNRKEVIYMTMEFVTVKNKANVEYSFKLPFKWYKKTWGKAYTPTKEARIILAQFKEWTLI